jgi:hypothetical protein
MAQGQDEVRFSLLPSLPQALAGSRIKIWNEGLMV